MAFCLKCGSQLRENDIFCVSCGSRVPEPAAEPATVTAPASAPAVAQTSPLCPPSFYPPMYLRPVVPGRGVGIISSVLGVISMVSVFSVYYLIYLLLYVESETVSSFYSSRDSVIAETVWEVLAPYIVILFLAMVGSICFGFIARTKGYRTVVSNTGIVLGFLAFGLLLVALIKLLVA